MARTPRIAISLGNPSGVGPEVTAAPAAAAVANLDGELIAIDPDLGVPKLHAVVPRVHVRDHAEGFYDAYAERPRFAAEGPAGKVGGGVAGAQAAAAGEDGASGFDPARHRRRGCAHAG